MVTAQLARGRNALGALLAPGWYESALEWFQQPNNYGDTSPALLAQLRMEYQRVVARHQGPGEARDLLDCHPVSSWNSDFGKTKFEARHPLT